jgi:Holliday junction resolvase RusA-like endonuclease
MKVIYKLPVRLCILLLHFILQSSHAYLIPKHQTLRYPSRSLATKAVSAEPTSSSSTLEKSKKPKGSTSKKTSTKSKKATAPKTSTKSSITAKAKTTRAKGSDKSPAQKSTTSKNAAVKKVRKAKKDTGPAHWIDESDPFDIDYKDVDGQATVSQLWFKVRGNPRPLVRHRTGRGFVYNPSAHLQESFRQVVQDLVFSDGLHPPLFSSPDDDHCLVMTIVFRLKRPKKHFVGGKPGPERMRDNAPLQTSPTRTDVDNLCKFVLDSLNEVLYADDKQIVSVQITKLLDNEGLCEGSTEIRLRSMKDHEVDTLISNSFGILEER